MSEDPTDESERRYRQLVETSPAPINLFDADGEVIWGNDAVLDLLGLDAREALVGRSIFEFIHPADHEAAKRELRAVVEEKTATGPTTMRLRRADGDERRILVATAPGRYEGRDIGQAVVIDVTPLEELREDLEVERGYFEEAVDALQDVLYVLDADGSLERWNDALVDVTGLDEVALAGANVETVVADEHVERFSRSLSRALEAGEAVVEVTVVGADGRRIPYEFRQRRLGEAAAHRGIVGIGRDVADRRARDQHLRAVDRLLQHSLRNKLNVVLGSAKQLREDAESDVAEPVDRIDGAAEEVLSIFEHHRYIVDLLTDHESAVPIELPPLVEKAVRDRREAHPSAEIAAGAVPDVTVSAVPELDRALRELIDNAVVHHDGDVPTVSVRAETDGRRVRLRVVDDGPRIPAMERQVVTGAEPVDPTFHSAGLGLWFVHWVVERSGGTLSFEDNEPRGNVVTVELSARPNGST